MHGRKIVRSSADAAAAKKAKDALRIANYRETVAKVAEKRATGQLDAEAFELTTTLLSQNPEYYTMWNVRREILERFWETASMEDKQTRCKSELRFGQESIKQNPKSYWVWNHRRWILEHMPEPEWEREFKLITGMLSLDARNFHGWDYRRFLISSSTLTTPQSEVDYTSKKISENFSNYSAWHYRSKLIPVVYPEGPERDAAIAKDLETVRSAIYTEPADQSAWFYQRWLIGREDPEPACLGASVIDGTLYAVFNQPLRSTDAADLEATLELPPNPPTTLRFLPAVSPPRLAKLWHTRIPSSLSSLSLLIAKLTFSGGATDSFGRVLKASTVPIMMPGASTPLAPSPSMLRTRALVEAEEPYMAELLSLEPEAKWPLLTESHFLSILDRDATPLLNQLPISDPLRARYHADRASSLFFSRLLPFTSLTIPESLIANGKNLTRIIKTEFLFACTSVDLSGNPGLDKIPFAAFKSARTINVDGTSVDRLTGIADLEFLEEVSAKGCKIRDLGGLNADLGGVKSKVLRKLELEGNPVVLEEGFEELRRSLSCLVV